MFTDLGIKTYLKLTEYTGDFLGAAAPTVDYPVKCDLRNAINPIFGFFIGQAKGVLPAIGYALIFFIAVWIIIRGNKADGAMAWALYIIGGLLALTVIGPFLNAVSPDPCTQQDA